MRMTFPIMAMTIIYMNLLIVSLVKFTSLFVTNAFVILTGALFRLHTKENLSMVVIDFFIFNLNLSYRDRV
jgi:hypothetical protein